MNSNGELFNNGKVDPVTLGHQPTYRLLRQKKKKIKGIDTQRRLESRPLDQDSGVTKDTEL